MAGLARPSHYCVGLNVCDQHESFTRSANLAFMNCLVPSSEICLAELFQIGSMKFAHSFHSVMIVDRASTPIEFTVAIIYPQILLP